MSNVRPPKQSTEADIEALEKICERLYGFGLDVSLEWVDGFLTALVAGRRIVQPAEWLPAMFGEDFERAYGDPTEVATAMEALTGRWNILANQLDPESLMDEPDAMRLTPLMITYDDAARAEVVAAGQITADEAEDLLQTGAGWCDGFQAAMEAFPDDWPEPDVDSEEGRWYDDCLTRVLALSLPKAELAAYVAEAYPGEELTRDQLIDDACFGVQDLRLY